MSGYAFTPSAEADPAVLAEFHARVAKLAPACTRCGGRLVKRDLEAGTCSDREVCRIRRAGGTVAGFVSLRAYRRKHPTPVRPCSPTEEAIARAEQVSSTVRELAVRAALEQAAAFPVAPVPPAPPFDASRPTVPPATCSTLVGSWAAMWAAPDDH